MMSRTQLLRGLWEPAIHSYQLKSTETIPGLWRRLVLIAFISALLFGVSAYFGIGSEYISKKMTDLSNEEYEMHKAFYVVGQMLWGIVYATCILFIPAILFWTLTDLEMYKLITIQFMVLAILLMEKIVMIPINLAGGLAGISSPFSLGVMGQYLTGNDIVLYFLAAITLFKIWTVFIQYKYLSVLSDRGPKLLLAAVIAMNLSFWFMSALLSYIQLEKLI